MNESQEKVSIIGIPMDLGQDLRGVDMGPGALRYAGLKRRVERLGYLVEDWGNINVPVRDKIANQKNIHYLPATVEVLKEAYDEALNTIECNCFPIFLGGDHSISIGTIGGVSENSDVGVIWLDAHGDFNTHETTPSGNIHGMPLATLNGQGHPDLVNLGRKGQKIPSENIVLMGIRDIDEEEKRLIRESRISAFTMREIDELGIATVVHQALKKLSHVDTIHLSMDMDVMDPEIAPGVGTPVPGGLTYREAHTTMEILADSKRVKSLDICEVNPILDIENKTARMSVELVASLLGKSIL
jgi:arginase